MEHHPLDELLGIRGRTGSPYNEVLRAASLSAGVYELAVGDEDRQQPHGEDEVYVVLRGRASVTVGGETAPVAPGSLVFVAAGVAHRFHDIEEHLALVVVFAPPEGTALPT